MITKRLFSLVCSIGVAAFIDSMVVGVSSLMWSAEFAADDEEEIERKKNMTAEDTAKEEKMWGLMMTGTVLFSVCFSVGLFFLLPYLLASFLRRFGVSEIGVSVAEALLRVCIFMTYMFLISRMKDIQRVRSTEPSTSALTASRTAGTSQCRTSSRPPAATSAAGRASCSSSSSSR